MVIDVAGQDYEFETEPVCRSDGEPFRLAFMDLGPPIESSYLCLKGFAEGLQALGYISEGVDFSKAPQDFYEYYDFMLSQDLGPYVSFDEKPYMIGEGNDDEIAAQLSEECSAGRLDMVVATGTDPGIFLKDLGLDIPFLVCLATDPVASGIIDSAEDTGDDRIWALVEPNPYKRQFEGYRNMLGFDRLCMVTVNGMDTITGNPLYREKAAELGVVVDEINFSEEESLKDDYDEKIEEALRSADLSEDDAILFAYGTMDDENAPALSSFAADAGIPSLIGDGDSISENGGMMCLSCFDYEGYGAYAAMVASNVFHGHNAGDQPCIYTSSPHVVLNMTTAKNSGFVTTFDLLRGIDRIYR
ncbi:MAG: hypothetical protein K6G58_02085 [Lachnospiraceae bacterium]|nr:hypothetical protein [Lachnospiraceae bacterium]